MALSSLGSVLCDALLLFVTDLKCFQSVLVSFCEVIDSEKCFFFALRMRSRVLFRCNFYCVQFLARLNVSLVLRALSISGVNHTPYNRSGKRFDLTLLVFIGACLSNLP